MDFSGFRRGFAWNQRRCAQRDAHWAYFGLQDADDRTLQNNFVRVPSLEEIPAPTSERSGKRGQAEDAVSTGRSSKSSQTSGNARNLVPHYQSTPTDAIPISVPTYDSKGDWTPKHEERQTQNMGGMYRPSGGVKPTNTLGKSSVQSTRAMRSPTAQPRHSVGFRQFTKEAKQQQLDVSASRGSNVASSRRLVDDIEGYSPPHKKPKLTLSGLVDLTGDDGELPSDALDLTQGQPISAKSARHTSASQRSTAELSDRSRKRHLGGGDIFGNNELYSVDKEAHNWQPKQSRRRAKAGPASLHDNDSLEQLQGTQPHHCNGTAQAPVDLDADDAVATKDKTGPIASRHTIRADLEEVPVIDLSKGLKEAGDEHRRKRLKGGQGSASDMNQVNNIMAAAGYSNPVQNLIRGPPIAPARRIFPPPQVPTTKLQHKFRRDVEEIEDDDPVLVDKKSTRAQDRLQASEGRISSRDGSPDELDGARTVPLRNLQNASPAKGIPVISRSGDKLKGAPSKIRSPSSSLKPTSPTQLSEKRMPTASNAADDIGRAPREANNSDDDERIAISTIISKGYTNTASGLALVWHHNEGCFLLVDAEGTFIYSPLQSCPVTVGANAVAHAIVTNRESLRVILKGTSNMMSTGNILLQFATRKAKDMFYNALCDTPGTKLIEETSERLDASFSKLGHLGTDGFLKAQEQARAQSRAHVAHSNLVRAQSRRLDQDIVYEDEQPAHTKAVSKMRGETLLNVLEHEQQQSDPIRIRQSHDETTSYHLAQPTRKSSRQPKLPVRYREASPKVEKWTEVHGLPKWAKSILYPLEGTRRVPVESEDLKHLDAGEFLNDNIVNYALRDIEEKMLPEQKERIHFFNTFFFTSLTAKNGKKGINYEAVKKWTKNVDLFSKEYVVVPINLDLHWFVAIIYNLPALDRRMIDSDDLASPAADTIEAGTSAKFEVPRSKLEQMSLSDNPDPVEGDSAADRVDLEDLEPAGSEPVVVAAKGKRGTKKKPGPVRKFTGNEPTIISLDSFGISRNQETRIIKEYIVAEARDKRQMDVTIEDLQGMNAKGIPQQDNFYDCGVYLIGYMKQFMRDPDRFIKRILGREMATSDFAEFDTSALRDQIRDDLLEYGKRADDKYRAERASRASARKNVHTPQTSKTRSRRQAVDAGAAPPPTSSQPKLDSPTAQKLGRRPVTPHAPKTPVTSTGVSHGSGGAEAPTSTTFQGDTDATQELPTDDDTDLEVDVPQPLLKSRKIASSRSPRSSRSDKQVAEDDNEMLDSADAPADSTIAVVGKQGTPYGKSALTAHNHHLSPLSSLERDNSQQGVTSRATLYPDQVIASVKGTIQVKVREEDEIENQLDKTEDENGVKQDSPEVEDEQHGDEDDDIEFESESGVTDVNRGPITVISIGDEGDPDTLAEEEWHGLDDLPTEIPDSQPDIQQSQQTLSLQHN